ncbi:MAG: PAS domain S-box protein [Candidatus Tectimicrobiota bacterium]
MHWSRVRSRLHRVLLGLLGLSCCGMLISTVFPLVLPSGQSLQPWQLLSLGSGMALVTLCLYTSVAQTRYLSQARQALHDSATQFQSIVDSAIQGIVIHQDERIQYVNLACVRMFGYDTPEDLLGQHAWQILAPPAYWSTIQARVTALLSGASLPPLLYAGCHRSGQPLWVKSTAKQTLWAGRPAVVAFFVEVTAQQQAEQALRLSDERLTQLAAVLPQVLYMMDAMVTQIFYISPAYETVWGSSRDSIYRNPRALLDTIHPADRAQFATWLDQQDLATFDVEYRIIRPDGSTRWIWSRGVRTRGSDEATSYVVGMAEDITTRKQMEMALATRVQQLEAARVVAEDITRELDLARLLALILQRAAALLNVSAGSISLWDVHTHTLVPQAWMGREEAWMHTWRTPYGQGLGGTVVQRLEGLIVNDYLHSAYVLPEVLEHRHPVPTAAIAEPLCYRDRCIGVLILDNAGGDSLFTSDDQQLLKLFAAQAAVAIENARLFQEVQQQTAALHQVNKTLWEEMAERASMTEALRASEARYRAVVEGSIQGVYVHQDGIIQFANQAAADILGYAHPEQLIGQPYDVAILPEYRQQAEAHRLARLQGESVPERFEHPGLRHDGSLVWLEILASRLLWNGQPAIQIVMLDISARTAAEQALRDSEARLRLLTDALPVFIAHIDANHRYRWTNKHYEMCLGRARDDINGRHVSEVLGEPMYLLLRPHIQAALAGTTRSFETVAPALDGTRCYLTGTYIPEVHSTGAVVGIFSIHQDITEQRALEQALLVVSEREQRRLGQDLHDGLGQHLSGLAFLSAILAQKLQEQGHPEAPQAARVHQLMEEAIALTRHLARSLYPLELDKADLLTALQSLALRIEDTFGLSCQVRATPLSYQPNASETIHLYRIAQEAINNAVKHGKVQQIIVHLTNTASCLRLAIIDDGTGFTASTPDTSGMGLRSMHYRAHMIGAALTIHSVADGGTEVVCGLPLVPAQEPRTI